MLDYFAIIEYMSDQTEYKDGSHSDFIHYLFGNDPKPRNTIVLESPPNDASKNPGLHTFEQLLMIFVDGLRYFHGSSGSEGSSGRRGQVNINALVAEDIAHIQGYFHSMNYDAMVETFETIHEYQFRYPNYFRDQDKITGECVLKDFFYEIYGDNNKVFRISFEYL
jgi:hypothetical protein